MIRLSRPVFVFEVDVSEQRMSIAAGTDVSGFARIPDGGATNPENDFGFPGLWPNLYPFRSFDPAMTPDQTVTRSCTGVVVTGYGSTKNCRR